MHCGVIATLDAPNNLEAYMDSFLKDALSALVLAGWVFPVLYLTVALTVGKVVALYRRLAGRRTSAPVTRRPAPVAVAAESVAAASAPVSTRRRPVAAVGMSATATRLARPRVASRWKSSQRLSAGAC